MGWYYRIFQWTGGALKGLYRLQIIYDGTVSESYDLPTYAEAAAKGAERVAALTGAYIRKHGQLTPVPPTPSPGPTPQPGPEPTPWPDGEGGGWDVLPTPDGGGGGTYAGWDFMGVSGSAWEYPSMWFEASPWGSDSMWNYSNAWTGFTSAGSWDSGGTWGESSSGWLTGLAAWFGSLFS